MHIKKDTPSIFPRDIHHRHKTLRPITLSIICHPERSRGTLCSPGGKTNRDYHFSVYIMQSASRRALYIGMTSNLMKRVWQHKNHISEGFTDDYNATRLAYWEGFEDVLNAIDREKQLKGWRREKKLQLIARMNPLWHDLAANW
jgi:putative endonuclease